MKPLNVALVHRDSPRAMNNRMVGIWSSPVPEFTWTHFPVEKKFKLNRDDFAEEFDLIWYEDGKLHGKWYGIAEIPICYHVVDSTLSPDHYLIRRTQAEAVDLICLDHEALERFTWNGGPPVRRLSHCINTRYFKDWGLEKTVDVSFHCRTKGDSERPKMQEWLKEFCYNKGYRYDYGLRKNEEYGQAFNRSKITVNWSRTELNRPHRVFDAMGCRTCLLTRTLPKVEGEEYPAEKYDPPAYFVEFDNYAELSIDIKYLVEAETWRGIADAGYQLVHEKHTWPVRAKELRAMIDEIFPHLSEDEDEPDTPSSVPWV